MSHDSNEYLRLVRYKRRPTMYTNTIQTLVFVIQTYQKTVVHAYKRRFQTVICFVTLKLYFIASQAYK